MRIAFDLDDVLKSREKYMLAAENKDKTLNGYRVVNPSGYDIEEIYKCSKEKEISFWTKNALPYSKMPLFDDAEEVFQQLKKEGHEICILTSRAKGTEKSIKGFIMRRLVNYELRKIRKYIDKIIYTELEKGPLANEKGKACLKHKIDIMVEDDIKNIEGIKRHSKSTFNICMNTRNNRKKEINNTPRADTLDEAYEEISAYINKRESFKVLSKRERDELTLSQQEEYNKKLVNYYKSLPYDIERSNKEKKQCIKFFKLTQPVFNFFYKPTVINKNSPARKEIGNIYVSNHLHSFDPYLTNEATSNTTGFVLFAKEKIRNQMVGPLFKYIGSTFRDDNDYRSQKISNTKILKHLVHGRDVIWYPEGTRNKQAANNQGNKPLQQFSYGIYRNAEIMGSDMYHFAINDDYRLFNNNLKIVQGKKINIPVGSNLEEKIEESRNIIKCLQKVK